MKFTICILSAIFLGSCKTTRHPGFIPREFQYTEDSIGEGKTFVFYNGLHNDYTYADLKWVYANNKKMKSLLQYSSNFKLDSVIEFDGRITALYYQLSVLSPIMYKASQVKKRIGNNKMKYSIIVHSDSISMKVFSKSIILKDTSLLWNGEYVPCIVTKTIGKFRDASKQYAAINGVQHVVSYNYYAKGIGKIRYSSVSTYKKEKPKNSTWELVSIQNLNKEKQGN